MKKILVTGGLGFIGSHTVVELQNEGFEVVIIDDLSNSSVTVLEGIVNITSIKPAFIQLDLKNKPAVIDFFNTHKDIVGVIHFAASKAVGESVKNPLLYYENNITTLVYVLQELEKHNIPNFIFSSSCTVYGQADELPITENAPVKKAESPYGNTKQIGEEIIQDVCKISENLNAIALRYFNPVGAHASTQIGELPIGTPQNLVPFITQTAIGLREQLSVFGNDYPTNDGTAVRDYIHVVDLAKAHVVALQRLLKNDSKNKYETFNIGTGTGSSVLEVIHAFEKVSGTKLNYKIVDRRAGDITAAYANTTKVNNQLGWEAQLTLEDAMRDAWLWEQKIRSKKMKSIVSIEWLKENLENPKLVVLYSNLGDKKAPTHYIKNSRLFDIKNTFSNLESNFPNTLPSPELFQKNCQQLGINNDHIVVVYDHRNMVSSPRVWWLFKTMGFHNVAVLNGGLQAWEESKFTVSKTLTNQFKNGNFKAHFNSCSVQYFEKIKQNISQQKLTVIDARSADRFDGIIAEPRKGLRSGNIPNSINLPYTTVLENGFFKSEYQLKQIFKAIPTQNPMVFTCGSGVTACVILLAAHQVLKNKLSIYDGSWTEWGTLFKDS